ncbi:aminotransferase-like domain-containing protein [Maribacter litoralis]|uniref:GntR family transcriptional regulator n=1 Tax=Maribacter litoralis TaxID=2059726 RepID=A0A653LIQ2_9FLAO|nr:PLP-dependent aminotransferase family protein [Maribacter litoralis]VXA91849.1 GntR family transcriptional regulator [Maribacter litoralis]
MKNLDNKDFLYLKIGHKIERQIQSGVLKLGDKLPSTRIMGQQYGVSISTVLQAYYYLESKSLIASKPRSGYYVTFSAHTLPDSPAMSNPDPNSILGKNTELIIDFFQNISTETVVNLSLGVPSEKLLPIAKLNKVLHEAIGSLTHGGTIQGDILGKKKLRRQIAQRSALWGGVLTEDDVIITSGCTSALSLALMAVTEPGDTIAVESPVYFGLIQLANTLGLRVIELPTHPLYGMDTEALQTAIDTNEIKAVAVISNFSNPMGNTMSDNSKKALVEIIEKHNIPLIEDDIYGEIYYGDHRPTTCKTYDTKGLVLLCSSFSKTLSSGYRIGWISPGKFKAEVIRLKLYVSSTTTTVTEEAVSLFLEKGRYDHHLRKLRQRLHANSLQFLVAIGKYFPEETKVSRPQGSFLLWVQLPAHIDTRVLYKSAVANGVRFSPGRIFTLQEQYCNCMRLSYALEWNNKVDDALKCLGQLIKDYK